MTPDEALLADICEHPEDDAPRLIYADWLEEHGDEEARDRAQIIRLQVEVAKLLPDDPQGESLTQRAAALYSKHRELWRQRLPRLKGISWLRFSRGFVSGAEVQRWCYYRTQAEQLYATAPIEFLRFRSLTPQTCQEFVTSPLLRRLVGLDLAENGIATRGARILAGCAHLCSLRSLIVRGPSPEDWRYRFGQLVQINDGGAYALAASPHLEGLTLLDLRFNQISDRAAQALRDRFGARVLL